MWSCFSKMINVKGRIGYPNIVGICAIILIALEMALFPIIHIGSWKAASLACYTAVILTATFGLVSFLGDRKGDLIRLGLLLTLVADYFLVIEYDSYLEGVVAFTGVQLCYFAYTLVKEQRNKVRNLNALTRAAFIAVLLIACFIILGDEADALSIVSVIYYGNLVANVVFAFLLGREERLFAIGLTLFAMCDLCIGLDVLFESYLGSPLGIFYGDYFNLPWVFYQPSQILIALHLGRKIYAHKDGCVA